MRYRTGDITALNHETCSGRTTVRMNRSAAAPTTCSSSAGDVFPQTEEALLHVPGVSPNYMIIVDRAKNILDTLEVWVEVDAEAFSDKLGRLADLQRAAERHLYEIIGINAYIKLVEPNTIARSEGKAKRVVDRRDVYQIKG